MIRPSRRILFITDAPAFGGAERYLVSMGRAAGQCGMSASLLWIKPDAAADDIFADWPTGAGLEVIDADEVNNTVSLCARVRRVLRAYRPNAAIINACGRPRFWMLPYVARYCGVPAAWVHQMVDHNDYRRLAPRWLGGRMEGLHAWRVPQALRHKLAAMAARSIITLNAEDARQVAREHGVHPSKIHTVPHGVDTRQYAFDPDRRDRMRSGLRGDGGSLPREPFVIGTAGRLVAGKGIEMVIEATADLRKRGIPAIAVVAGDGPQRDEFVRMADLHGVGDVVRFCGGVDDMATFYCGLDVFALCSSTESFGLAIAEAMACERPVIATPTAGASLQIEHGISGMLLERFSAGQLAEAIAALHAEPHLRERLGHQARWRVQSQFSIDLTLERTLRSLRKPAASDGIDCRSRRATFMPRVGGGAA